MTAPGHGGGKGLTMMLGLSVLSLMGGLVFATARLGAASIPIWALGMVAVAVVLRGPLGKSIAARIGGGEGSEAIESAMHQTYAELDDLRGRLVEVEERLDFSERMLASISADHGTEGRDG